MSTRAVIGWLVVAIALGVAAILLILVPQNAGTPSGAVPVGDRLLDFIPGDVRQITVQTTGGPQQIIERAPAGKGLLGADAEWQLRIEPASGDKAPPPWPLESAKVQGLIRILSEAKAVAVPAADATVGDRSTRVDLVFPDATATWLLSDRTLAGTGLVRLEAFRKQPARQAVVREDLIRVFTDPGPKGWRDRFPLSGITADASRIKLTNSNHTLSLARQEGKWYLREPVAAPADPAAVKHLLSDLGHTEITDFLDTSTAAATLASPTATIIIEADRRVIDPGATEPRITTDSLTLTVGGAAGPSLVYARIGDVREVVLDAKPLTFSSDPATYVWPYPMRESPSNIGVLSFKLESEASDAPEVRSFRRSTGKWVQLMPSGKDGALSDREQGDVDALVMCLTGESLRKGPNSPAPPAGEVSLTAPENFRRVCTLRIGSLASSPLETIDIGWSGDRLILKTGPIYRSYPPDKLPSPLSTLPRAPQATPAPTR
jgi:hypothetical protein